MSVEIVDFSANSKSNELLKDLIASKDINLTEQEKIVLASEFNNENKQSIKFSFPLSKPFKLKCFESLKSCKLITIRVEGEVIYNSGLGISCCNIGGR